MGWVCVPPCPAGRTYCAELGCLDLTRTAYSCGACGLACPRNNECHAGRCVDAACVGAACTSTTACGVSAVRCASGGTITATACVAGVCRPSFIPSVADCDGTGQGVNLQRDDAHCGACGRRCGVDATCRDGACVTRDVRPTSPLSVAVVTSHRPRFRWTTSGDAAVTGVRLELCATRSCARVLRSLTLTGEEHRLVDPLEPGVYFWRLRAMRGDAVAVVASATWEFVVTERDTDAPNVSGYVLDMDGDGLDDTTVAHGVRLGASGAEVPLDISGDVLGSVWLSDALRDGPPELAMVSAIDEDGDGLSDLSASWEIRRSYGAGFQAWGGFRSFSGSASRLFAGRQWVYEGSVTSDRDETPLSARWRRETVTLLGIGDLDGDGLADQLFRRTSESNFSTTPYVSLEVSSWARDRGTATDDGAERSMYLGSGAAMSVGDFNADGLMDFVLCPNALSEGGRCSVTYGARWTVWGERRCLDPRDATDSADPVDDGYDDAVVSISRHALVWRGSARGLIDRPCCP